MNEGGDDHILLFGLQRFEDHHRRVGFRLSLFDEGLAFGNRFLDRWLGEVDLLRLAGCWNYCRRGCFDGWCIGRDSSVAAGVVSATFQPESSLPQSSPPLLTLRADASTGVVTVAALVSADASGVATEDAPPVACLFLGRGGAVVAGAVAFLLMVIGFSSVPVSLLCAGLRFRIRTHLPTSRAGRR